jgi:putative ABC transport system permease protein
VRQVLLAQLRTHAARLVASTLAVVIAVGFVVATLVLDQTSRATMLRAVGAQYVDSAAVVTAEDGSDLSAEADALTRLEPVRAVAPSRETSVQALLPGRTGAQYVLVDALADDPALRWQRLSAGALPDAPGEIALSDRAPAAVGDVLTVTSYDAQGTALTSQVTVTGTVDLGGDPTAGRYERAFVTPQRGHPGSPTGPWPTASPLRSPAGT